ncbi:HR-like lesion-inducing protein [Medicago truncatula]|uniref:HR-like lesion-inducing protein n=1 Tax=Medicago truncatula TaxID=3880 RepID=A0A072UDL9_MEDTR|nr:HR-like lesion-inducing protein [Medicago truncatula]
MAFASFLGRVLFASVFILSAYQEFNDYGVDGGLAAKAIRPKFDAFIHKVDSQVGFNLPEIDIKFLVAGAIALKGIGGILFILGSSFGAVLLVCSLNSLLVIEFIFMSSALFNMVLFSL